MISLPLLMRIVYWLIISEVWDSDQTVDGRSLVGHIFSFALEGTGKGEMFVNNAWIYCICVGCFLTLLHILWSLEVMSQVIKCGNVLTKGEKSLNFNQLDGLETNLKFCIVLLFLSTAMQIRITEDFEAFCILDFRRVQQSTLSRSPREKKKNIICTVDWTCCNVNPV